MVQKLKTGGKGRHPAFVTCYIGSGDEAEHHEDPQEHGADGGPAALSPPPAGTPGLPGPRATSRPVPVGPGCTLACSHSFSPPPSAAHDAQPSETTAMEVFEQEVHSFGGFTLRKFPLCLCKT